MRDFGPLHEFWTFLFERLNKVLKSYKTNNHNAGELETTFFREFHRTIATSRLVARSVLNDSDPARYIAQAGAFMFGATADDRGTVQALARELDEANLDGKSKYFLPLDLLILNFLDSDAVVYQTSPLYGYGRLNAGLYIDILSYLNRVFPEAHIRDYRDMSKGPGWVPLPPDATFLDYIVMNGRRYSASSRSKSPKNSWVTAIVSAAAETCVGELLDIINVQVSPTQQYVLGHFRWLGGIGDTDLDLAGTIWDSLYVHEVHYYSRCLKGLTHCLAEDREVLGWNCGRMVHLKQPWLHPFSYLSTSSSPTSLSSA